MGKLRNYFLNHYPRTDFHELNQDWMISMLFDMINQVENFVEMNSVKYADPIQWDITRQYEKNTIVVDAITGTAYISSKPVPMGVALSRSEYWSVIFDLGRFITLASQNFANSYEAVLTTTATMPTDKDKWVVWNSILYRAKNDIHVGDRYVIDGNIEKYTVEMFFDELAHLIAEETEARIEADAALHGEIVDESVARENADEALQGNIDAETTARQNADNALHTEIVNESVARENADDTLQDNIDAETTARQNADSELTSKIGTLNNLNTTNKSNAVSAINEVYARKFTFQTKSDLINTTAPIKNGDVVYVAECDTSYIIESTNSTISLPVNVKYAKLLPDNDGFYNITGLTTVPNQDILGIINYLISNEHTYFKFGRGEYNLSDTITITRTNTPQFKFIGAGKFDTVINCTKGFIDVSIDGYNFRGSEFIGFTASGVQTGVVGGNYHGFNFISKNNTPNDMLDNVKFSDMLIKYFDVGVRVVVRSIWNLWTDCEFLYNNLGFAFSKTSNDSFFNCNTFINCRFSTNKARAVTIYAKSGQAVSNNFVGCSIEGSYYTNEESAGNIVELDLYNVGVLLTGCHFEKANTLVNATAICAVNSNVLLNECYFYNYTNHAYVNSNSMLVFNSPSLYGGTSLTAYGTDTGTTVKNNPYTFV